MNGIWTSLVIVFVGVLFVFAGNEGVVGDQGADINRSMRSVADWYTVKSMKMSAVAANIVVTTKYNGLILKGFYNNRRDSSVAVKCILFSGDTMSVSVPSESYTGKLPVISKILQSGTTDSVYLLFQKQ